MPAGRWTTPSPGHDPETVSSRFENTPRWTSVQRTKVTPEKWTEFRGGREKVRSYRAIDSLIQKPLHYARPLQGGMI